MDNGETETTMVDDVIETQTGLIRRAPREVVLMPVMNVQLAKQRLTELQEFCANYLDESTDGGTDGGDYGVIPGAGKKKVLFKSGAEKLCDVYGLADRYSIISKVEDFEHGLFDYTIECTLIRKTDEMFVGSGLGACSTWESKYRWRDSKRVCPKCDQAAIIKGRDDFGGGWICWDKRGGCGAKFKDGDQVIESQKIGRIENPDIFDYKNTVLKIAKKRAKIDAVIGVTRSSGIFTQDLDEHELTAEKLVVSTTAPVKTIAAPVKAVEKPVETAQAPTETHAEKIARIKKEAAARQPAAVATTGPHAPDTDVQQTVEPTAQSLPVTPVEAPAPAPDGHVHITAINVKNGPLVMKDGVTKPSWGPLYIIAFSHKVKASDGVLVSDASTFDQDVAAKAEGARDTGKAMQPVLEPGTKKGSYKLVRFE